MALKGDRYEFLTDIAYFGNSVMTRGGIASYSTMGSGGAMDQSQALVAYAAASTGNIPAGLLLNDMVSIDLTRMHINYYRDEVIIGGKVTLGRRGWWVTDQIVGTPAVGDVALLSNSGTVQPLSFASFQAGTYAKSVNPKIGTFLSTKDEDGFAKLYVEL